jgi:serine/threonine-protein kinase RsbW
MNTGKKTYHISLDFVSDLKFTEFCVLVFGYLRNILTLEDDDFFKVEMSLREVINNAIVHGNKSDSAKRVYVKFSWSKSFLRLSVRDESEQKIDFNEINKKLAKNDLLAFNGRGILIMKSYMDSVRFFPSEKGTEIVMEKSL